MGVGSRWSARGQPQVQGFPLSQRGIQIPFPDQSMASPSRENPQKTAQNVKLDWAEMEWHFPNGEPGDEQLFPPGPQGWCCRMATAVS